MPRGVPGTLTHSASAYRRGACREACCREHHRVDAAAKRAEGRMGMNSGREIVVTSDGTIAHLTRRQAEVLEAWLHDGGDPETVGRRTGVSGNRVTHVLGLIQQAYGFSTRAGMALAIERKEASYEVVASNTRRRRDVAV